MSAGSYVVPWDEPMNPIEAISLLLRGGRRPPPILPESVPLITRARDSLGRLANQTKAFVREALFPTDEVGQFPLNVSPDLVHNRMMRRYRVKGNFFKN